MRIVCWIPEATDTHSGFVTLPQQKYYFLRDVLFATKGNRFIFTAFLNPAKTIFEVS